MKVECTPVGERGIRGRVSAMPWAMLAALVAIVTAAPAAAADKVEVETVATAAADLNPDYQGRPSPVNIIIFELASADGFRNADFFSLFEEGSPILGGDLLGRTQLLLQPGEVREWTAEFNGESRFIGIVAAFRDIENAQWRSLVELPEHGFLGRLFKNDKLRITVDSLAVSIATK